MSHSKEDSIINEGRFPKILLELFSCFRVFIARGALVKEFGNERRKLLLPALRTLTEGPSLFQGQPDMLPQAHTWRSSPDESRLLAVMIFPGTSISYLPSSMKGALCSARCFSRNLSALTRFQTGGPACRRTAGRFPQAVR